MASPDTSDPPVRDAATVILVRDPGGTEPAVLMGQRGRNAIFMPDKFVFPGGAVDADDSAVGLAAPLGEPCRTRLRADAGPVLPETLAIAAIRELWEETGLILGRPARWPDAPHGWTGFAATGARPAAGHLHFFFRAITPPGRPRRFDARFFIADAGVALGDTEGFSGASDELRHLQWVPIARAQTLDLPFITEVVLAEVAAALPRIGPPEAVPFFRNDDEEVLYRRIRG